MMNLALVRCKMRKVPSPDINDKLIPILSSFFCCRQEEKFKKPAPDFDGAGSSKSSIEERLLDWRAIPYKVGDKLSR